MVSAAAEYSVLKLAGCVAPLVPAPTVTSTQENSLPLQPEGLSQWRLEAAVELLPHLVEAVHGAGAVVRVRQAVAGWPNWCRWSAGTGRPAGCRRW